MKPFKNGTKSSRKIRIEEPYIQTPEEEALWRDVKKFADLIPSEPEPNMGRIHEIKEEIRRGAYVTPEMIEETVARLAVRFMKRE